MAPFYPILVSKKVSMRKCILLCIILFLAHPLFALPVISSFAPVSGPVGTTVTINGSGFSATPSANNVYFGAVKATVSAATATALTVTVPLGATYQPITVTINGFTAASAYPFLTTFTGGGIISSSTFQPVSNTSIAPNYRAVCSADFDGDGLPDLAACNYSGSTVTVYPNTSSGGQFALNVNGSIQLSAGSAPTAVCAGDLDGDGKQDLIVANFAGKTVSLFLNTSTPSHISFAAKSDITLTENPEGVGIGDVTGDGRPDLAITSSPGGTGHLLIYMPYISQGQLLASLYQTLTTAALDPCSPVIADIDGDGLTDIALTYLNGNSFSVYLRYYSFGYQFTRYTFSSSGNPGSLAVSDIDKDGKPDVVVTHQSDSTVSVFRNTSTPGNPAFAGSLNFRIQGNSVQAVVGDIDGDGKPDIAAVNTYHSATGQTMMSGLNSISVLKNTSTGGSVSFQNDVRIITGVLPMGIVLGDLNRDSIPDLAVVNTSDGTLSYISYKDSVHNIPRVFTPASGKTGATITITGAGFSGATSVTFGGVSAASFAVVSSTTITAVVGTGANGVVVVITPSGNDTLPGTFSYIPPPPVIHSFNPSQGGSGAQVVITGAYFTAATAVNVGGVTGTSFTVNSDTSITAVLGTVTAPGSVPVSVTTPYGADTLYGFYTGGPVISSFTPGSGPTGTAVTITGNHFNTVPTGNIVYFGAVKAIVSTATPTTLTVIVPPGASYQPITVTTNNLTAYADRPFIVTFPGGGTAFTTGSFGDKTDLPTGGAPYRAVAGDIDGDGKPDLVVVNTIDNTVSIIRNTGFGSGAITFATKTDFPTGASPSSVSLGDINGDGKPEIIVTNSSGGGSSVSVLQNTSVPGTVSFAPKIDYPTGTSTDTYPQSVAINDLDGDGKPDLAIANSSDSTVSILRNRSTVNSIVFDYRINYMVGFGSQSVSIADLDGDGLPDIAVANSGAATNNTLNTVSVLRNTSVPGSISFAARANVPAGISPYSVSIGDLDGDGKPDLAVANSGYFFNGTDYVSTVSIIKNTSVNGALSFVAKTDFITGWRPQSISIGDLDGDGKPDLALSSYDNNTVSVLRNTSTGNTVSFEPITDYATGNTPIGVSIADLDGDGKPDLIATNSASNTISILRNQGATITPVLTPKINGFSPDSAATGATVTITGKNFTGATGVFFGGTAATGMTVVSDSVITALVGPGATGSVRVVTPYGMDSLPGFTFVNLVAINIQQALQAYPNPSPNGVITVKHPVSAGNAQIRVVDMMGNVMKIVPANKNAATTTVNVTGITQGLYSIVWNDGNTVLTQSIFIQ